MPERLEQQMDARGAAYVILALDLDAFVDRASRNTLLYIRGRKEFNEFLQNYDLQDNRFQRDDTYRKIEQRGYELGVFNRILAEENFAPTYAVIKKNIKFPAKLEDNVQFKNKFLKIWQKWNFWLRLSGNGIITIILKLDSVKPRDLILLSRDVMGLQGQFDISSARRKLAELEAQESTQANQEKIESVLEFMDWVASHSIVDIEREFPAVVWQMAVEVVRQFVDACGGKFCQIEGDLPFELNLTAEPERNGVGRPREQYTVFHFTEVGHYDWDAKRRQVLTPKQILSEPYAGVVSGLLEGILIEGKRDYYYPIQNSVSTHNIVNRNKSSWDDELCVLTDRSAIIYPFTLRKSHKVVFSSQQIEYHKYWETILRGIEFGIETRLLVQVAKRVTADYLAEAIPILRVKKEPDYNSLEQFDFQAANAARLLAHLRTITVPHIIAQASYSVSKFDLFMQETGVREILNHAEANLNDLTFLIERSHDAYLQYESQRLNELALAITVIFGGLTFGLAILALPSFMADWGAESSGFMSSRWYYPFLSYAGELLVLGLVIMGMIMFLLAGASLLYKWKRRNALLRRSYRRL